MGGVLRTGFSHATGDAVIIQDADLEYYPNEYPIVVESIFNGECDVVYGSRSLNNKRKGYKANVVANHVLAMLSNVFTNQNLQIWKHATNVLKGM